MKKYTIISSFVIAIVMAAAISVSAFADSLTIKTDATVVNGGIEIGVSNHNGGTMVGANGSFAKLNSDIVISTDRDETSVSSDLKAEFVKGGAYIVTGTGDSSVGSAANGNVGSLWATTSATDADSCHHSSDTVKINTVAVASGNYSIGTYAGNDESSVDVSAAGHGVGIATTSATVTNEKVTDQTRIFATGVGNSEHPGLVTTIMNDDTTSVTAAWGCLVKYNLDVTARN